MKIATLFLQIILYNLCDGYKKASVIDEKTPSAKYDNPNFVKDRFKSEIYKPEMPETFKNRDRKPFNAAWMDYCDPYHCNDYHKTACGLNRATMRFKWFQSVCHLILNNQCATYRGALKYDVVDTKFCTIYVMYLRIGCPKVCDDEVDPICGISSRRNYAFVFRSRCAMDMMNCKNFWQEFDEADMSVCEHYLLGKK